MHCIVIFKGCKGEECYRGLRWTINKERAGNTRREIAEHSTSSERNLNKKHFLMVGSW